MKISKKLLLAFGLLSAVTSLFAQAPANDDFANRTVLTGASSSFNGTTALATKEVGEPNHAGNGGGKSVWYEWTPIATAPVTITSDGTAFRTLLAAYTGNAVDTLGAAVASSIEPNFGGTANITFTANAGVTYKIVVDTRNNGTGNTFAFTLVQAVPVPTVTLTSPGNGQSFTNPTTITLAANATPASGTITNVSFYRGGNILIGTLTGSPYTMVWNNLPEGSFTLTARATDTSGQTGTSPGVNVTIRPDGYFSTLLVATGSVWKYLDNGTDQGTAWQASAFDDSSWASGPAELGYGDLDEATVVADNATPGYVEPPESNRYVTTYFRRAFVVTNANAISNLVCSLRRDDGGIVYLNGTEIQRNGFNAGPILFDTLAINSTDEITLFPTNVNPALLVNGLNYLAVEIHQSTLTSSDISFDLQLIGEGADGNLSPLVALTSPTNGALYAPGTNITFTATATDPDGTVTNVAYYADGVKIGNATSGPNYTATWSNVPQGLYTLTAVATDNGGGNGTSAGVGITVNSSTVVPVTLIATGAVWKYLDNGTDQGTAWSALGFNDSAWAGGPAQLGYGEGDEATLNSFGPDAANKFITTYYRRDFVVTNAAAVSNVVLRLLRDDGAVVYINGVEVRRDNLPIGPITYTTLAPAAIGGVDETTYVTSTNIVSLNTGNNVLAVEMHQNAVASSDLSFDLELIANVVQGAAFSNAAAPFVLSQTPAAGSTVGALTSVQVTFNEAVNGVNAADLLINNVAATGLSGGGGSYTFTFAQPALGLVNFTWAVGHGIADQGATSLPFDGNASSNLWSYTLADTTPPTITTRVPAAGASVTNLTTLTVTFSETVQGVDAGDLLINGAPATGLSGSGATRTFTFAPPSYGTVAITWSAGHGLTDLSGNPFNATAAGATWNYDFQGPSLLLVATNANYQYFKGLTEASTPTTAWRDLAFDDSTWTNGPGPFAYDVAGGIDYTIGAGTLLPDMRNTYFSVFLRHSFAVPAAGALTNVILRHRIDDGVIVWLNGVEIFRANMGATGSEVAFDGAAGSTPDQADYTTLALPASVAALFQSGNNVLAVQGQNSTLASSDLITALELSATLLDPLALPPSVASLSPVAGNVFALTSLTVTFTEGVQGVDAADLLINGVPATGRSGVSNVWTWTFPQPAYGNVNVSFAGAANISDFDVPPKPFVGSGFSYTLLNPSAPTVASQTPLAGATVNALTSLAVNFSENVTGVSASDLLINGAPATGLTGGGSSYTFTFAQPAYGSVTLTWAAAHGITDTEAGLNPFNPAQAGNTWSYTLVDQTPPTVVAKNPPAGANVTNLTSLAVTFSENITGVNASDLLINGVPATGVSGGPATYSFTFAQPNTSVINLSWSPTHGLSDTAAVPNAFDPAGPGATWQYFTIDNVAPAVATITPPPSATVRDLTQVAVTFGEPVTGVNASDLRINNVAASQVAGSGSGPYTFTFTQPATGGVEIIWAAAHGITDLASPPNNFAGGEWNYLLNPNAVFTDKIVINEIMFQPPSFRTNDEWIELRNTDSAPLNLNGWQFTKGVDFIFPNVSIPAGGYLVIVADVDAFQIKYPGVTNFVGPWIGSLANNGQTIRLETSLGETVNEVSYASEGDWATRIRGPLLSGHRGWIWRSPAGDGSGPALELMNPALPNKHGRNWRSSLTTNGTPGVVNTVATTNIPPLILDLAHFPAVPRSTEPVVVTAKILDERTNGLIVTLFYRDASTITPPAFSTLTMFDDGAHNDGVSGDKFFAATIPAQANSTVVEFYVEAVDLSNTTNTWPAAAFDQNNLPGQFANALYQVDDTVYAFPQPLYKIIMTETERRERRVIETTDTQSNAEMNGSLITTDGTGTEVRYTIGLRERGAGSRGRIPANQRVNVPNDRRWKGQREFNLNTQYTESQYAGYLLSLKSGLETEWARIVRVTINNTNNANGGSPQFGCYIHVEAPNSDMAAAHFPEDDAGNVYRCTRPDTGLSVLTPPTAQSYINQGYIKSSNSSENDYSDLTNLTYVLNVVPNSNYTAAVRAAVNVEQWMLYFAVTALLSSEETSLGTGVGDDYGMYRGVKDPRFVLIAHDWDTVLNEGDTRPNNPNQSIFRATALPVNNKFMHWPEFEPIYYATLRRLCQTTFAPAELGRTLDEGLRDYVPTATIEAMKTFASNRVAYVLSVLPPDTNAPAIAPASLGGTITSNLTLAAASGPYTITSTLTVGSGATVTIQPGTIVRMNAGLNIVVANGGRLLAEGTAASPILFTRSGVSGNWGNLVINGAVGSPESRIAYARFEFNANNTGTPAIDVAAGTAVLDHLTFGNTGAPYIHVDGASFVISHCEFPTSTASFEPVHGNGGVKAGGRGLFYRNWFGKTIGYNDSVDFTLGNRPGSPIVQFLENVFTGSDDDLLDLDGTDAWVEGNIFLHVHRNGTPDSASAVSGGNDSGQTSEITIIGNLFYDVDQAATAKLGNFYTFWNNTVVRQSGAGFGDAGVTAVLNFADEGIAAARGMYVEGNIFYDIERLTRYVTNNTTLSSNITFNGNLMPLAWAGPGATNVLGAPLFKHVPTMAETTNFTNWASAQVLRDWLSLLPGSPGLATGPNGSDKGGNVPLGASVAVRPGATTNDAILAVGVNRSGGAITASGGFPNGSGYTHYKWRIDGGAWSGETPIATLISLPGFRSGAHRVDVSGRRDTGTYQDDADYGEIARVTSVFNVGARRVQFSEVLASNQAAVPHEGTHPDLIELYNPGSTTVDLSGLRLTDDAADPDKFIFDSGTTIPAGGYLVVYANDPDGTSGIHVGFGLSKDGQSLYLYDTVDHGGVLIDSITFGLQLADYSVGRVGTNWMLCVPTSGAANVPATAGSPTPLVINEILTAELTAFSDDFVEIYNPQGTPVSMSGLFFTDNPTGWPNRSMVPALTFIGAGGYVAFRADGKLDSGADHLDFSLAAERGLVALLNRDYSLIDCVVYGPQSTDVSQGTSPNNIYDNNFFTTPTPGAPNPAALATNSGVVINEVLAANSSILELDGSTPDWVEFFNLSGTNVNLGDYSLSDSTLLPRKYVFAPGTVIAAGGYLRLRCDDSLPASSTNTGFNIKAEGGSLYLFNQLTGGGALLNAVTYGLQAVDYSISRVPNGTGAWALTLPTPNGASILASTASATSVRVNEWLASPSSGEDWFELWNPNPQPVAIGGYYTTDDLNNRTKSPIPALSYLGASTNGYQRFWADSLPAAGANHANFKFAAGGESIGFANPAGTLVDSISFAAQAAGVSEGRFPDGTVTIARFPVTSSPGEANYLPLTNVVINEALTHTDPPLEDAIELRNLSGVAVNIGGWFLSDSKGSLRKFRIPNGTVIGANGYVVFYENAFNFDPTNNANAFSLSSAKGDEIYLSSADTNGTLSGYRGTVDFGAAQNGVPFGRYVTSDNRAEFVALSARSFGQDDPGSVAQFRTGTGLVNPYPKVGPVVIGQIMYHPPDVGTNDNTLEEFIELRNISGSAVALFDTTNTWRLRDGVDFDFPPGVSMAAGGRLLLVSFDPVNNPAQLAAFRAKYSADLSVPIFGPYSGKLANNDDKVELYRPDNPDAGFVPYVLVERVHYYDLPPWPTAADGVGSALLRVSLTGFGNNPSNWVAAIPNFGGSADSDGDGLPNAWEIQYGLNPNNPADANLDADGDGASNLQEYVAGTNPTQAGSVLRVTSVLAPSLNNARLTFFAVSNRTYTIEFKNALVDPTWSPLINIGSAATNRLIQTNTVVPLNTRFYRIRTP